MITAAAQAALVRATQEQQIILQAVYLRRPEHVRGTTIVAYLPNSAALGKTADATLIAIIGSAKPAVRKC